MQAIEPASLSRKLLHLANENILYKERKVKAHLLQTIPLFYIIFFHTFSSLVIFHIFLQLIDIE